MVAIALLFLTQAAWAAPNHPKPKGYLCHHVLKCSLTGDYKGVRSCQAGVDAHVLKRAHRIPESWSEIRILCDGQETYYGESVIEPIEGGIAIRPKDGKPISLELPIPQINTGNTEDLVSSWLRFDNERATELEGYCTIETQCMRVSLL